MSKILIIVPAFNEQKNIRAVLFEISSQTSELDIVVVNDGSSDDTEARVKQTGTKVISHSVNLGAGAAIQTGLKYAVNRNYDYAIVVDGDGQHDPSEVPNLLAAIEKTSSDVVVGSRFLTKDPRKIHWARRIGIFLFSKIASFIGQCRITDSTSGFRVYNKKAIVFLAAEIPFDFPDADMIISLLFAGFKITEVPVKIRERQAGSSMYSLLRSIYYPFKVFVSMAAVLLRSSFEKERVG